MLLGILEYRESELLTYTDEELYMLTGYTDLCKQSACLVTCVKFCNKKFSNTFKLKDPHQMRRQRTLTVSHQPQPGRLWGTHAWPSPLQAQSVAEFGFRFCGLNQAEKCLGLAGRPGWPRLNLSVCFSLMKWAWHANLPKDLKSKRREGEGGGGDSGTRLIFQIYQPHTSLVGNNG